VAAFHGLHPQHANDLAKIAGHEVQHLQRHGIQADLDAQICTLPLRAQHDCAAFPYVGISVAAGVITLKPSSQAFYYM